VNRHERRKLQAEARKLPPGEWIAIPSGEEPYRKPIPYPPERPEEDVKADCEKILADALRDRPPNHERRDDKWWTWCQTEACKHPGGCYTNVFWWSMRILGDPKENLDTFRGYLEWKWGEYESGRIRRDGPKWL